MRKFHVSHVWLPPPTKSVDRHGYLPTQYYDLNSSYGSFEDLKCLNRQLLASGLRPVADVVINHRSAECTDGDGRYNIYQDLVEHPGATMAWDQRAIASNDVKFGGKGGADTGADYPHAADLDHENPMVVAGITDWLSWLRGVGFEGFRFDYGFGFSPQVTAKYVSATLDIQPTEDGSLFGDFAVIEGWNSMNYNGSSLDPNQDRHRQEIVDYVSGTGGTCAAFDFTLKGVLQEAVSKRQYWRLMDNRGRAPGVNGWWPSRACTFLDNHDTGSTQNHWPFPNEALLQGYCYLLTHPGVPCLFLDHVLADGDGKFSRLVDLRIRAGIRADSKLEILHCTDSVYVARVTGSKSKVLVKLGPDFDMGPAAPDDSWSFWLSGNGWACWLAENL